MNVWHRRTAWLVGTYVLDLLLQLVILLGGLLGLATGLFGIKLFQRVLVEDMVRREEVCKAT